MSERLRPVAKSVADPIARGLGAIGFTPNGLTIIGVLIGVVAAAVIAAGHLLLGALILLIGAVFDMLDGSLARLTGTTSDFGAFFDSTLDRFSEAVVFLGLGAYFLRTGDDVAVLLSFAALIGSFLVSYARARAEALQIECKVGWLARPERIILVAAGLLTGWILIVLWLLAIFTNVTAIQRVYHVWRTTGGR
ncbi:MAG TPA: CDP-alcohol phosphatidyltransferase family protein [Dehalococcoidia bacterium]|nr:CDP-alcohol phosphatidyltransferase family protein [Dehalococcoidia bacterium]